MRENIRSKLFEHQVVHQIGFNRGVPFLGVSRNMCEENGHSFVCKNPVVFDSFLMFSYEVCVALVLGMFCGRLHVAHPLFGPDKILRLLLDL